MLITTIDSIVQALAKTGSDDISLANGKIGALVFYAYLFLTDSSHSNSNKVKTLFNEIIDEFESDKEIDLSYAGGITGLMSVISHFKNEEKLDFLQSVSVDDIRKPIFSQAIKWIECDFIDNLYGSVGIIHYFNQLDDSSSGEYVDALVSALAAKAINLGANKVAFINSFPDKRKQVLDFGFAHGMSGTLSVLLDVYEKQRCNEILYPIITQGINYILESKISMRAENGNYSFFPSNYNINTKEYTINNRLGWCYGDLNQVVLLYKAGKLLNKKEYIDYADIFGMATLSRITEESTQIDTSSFCHGTSGLAYIYLHLYKLSGELNYFKAHELWLNRTTDLLITEISHGKYNQENSFSLLDGLTGTGLVLLSSTSTGQLAWPKFILL